MLGKIATRTVVAGVEALLPYASIRNENQNLQVHRFCSLFLRTAPTPPAHAPALFVTPRQHLIDIRRIANIVGLGVCCRDTSDLA